MAIKLKTLTGKPADFALTVTSKTLDGVDVEITFTAIGRTLREWHPIYVKRLSEEANANIEAAETAEAAEAAEVAAAEAAAESAPVKDTPKRKKKRKKLEYNATETASKVEDALQRGADLVREFASGWDLELDFTDENIKNLIAQYPGVQQEAHQKYNQTLIGHRAKN